MLITRTQHVAYDVTYLVAVRGKGSVRSAKRPRPTFYTTREASFTGDVMLTKHADGRGYSITRLGHNGVGGRTHYFAPDSVVRVGNGTITMSEWFESADLFGTKPEKYTVTD